VILQRQTICTWQAANEATILTDPIHIFGNVLPTNCYLLVIESTMALDYDGYKPIFGGQADRRGDVCVAVYRSLFLFRQQQ